MTKHRCAVCRAKLGDLTLDERPLHEHYAKKHPQKLDYGRIMEHEPE